MRVDYNVYMYNYYTPGPFIRVLHMNSRDIWFWRLTSIYVHELSVLVTVSKTCIIVTQVSFLLSSEDLAVYNLL